MCLFVIDLVSMCHTLSRKKLAVNRQLATPASESDGYVLECSKQTADDGLLVESHISRLKRRSAVVLFI